MYSSDGLPTLYSEIPCSCYAVGVSLKVKGNPIKLDIRGGITVQVWENINSGLGGRKMRIIGYEQYADSSVLGRITLSQAGIDTTPLSPLERIKDIPPTCRCELIIDTTLTIEKPPGGGGPLVLLNTKPIRLLNDNLRQFPPQGEVFKLVEPVDFAPSSSPSQVFAQLLLEVYMTMTHNP